MILKFANNRNPDASDTGKASKAGTGNVPGPSDVQLWSEFQSGSEAAFATIYKNNVDRLYAYGLKLVRDKELVMDAIQDLFVELWDTKERLGKVRSIKSYLYKSLRRKLIAKAVKLRAVTAEFIDGDFYPEGEPSPERSLIEKQHFDLQRKKIKKALSSLNKNQQEIVHLKYNGGLSYQEIAETLDLDKKAVYNLMARAIHQLRSILVTFLFMGILLSSL
ncbi:sigma-70 family RNA polymerase sigma factor [Muricauda sp. TY007]|uniref:RNA polymerase sigma factor n=1 Tax=Allomuricauda sp. TY007 TaxID=2683200 RepID=UPI0013C20EB5|nr:sigma-70 family RNA polymerase sigma factor [Muricauda sp. TY007]NDV17490.1 sigma-70 family RNA polymerase sigma factor [Muricauda sp. TY007]